MPISGEKAFIKRTRAILAAVEQDLNEVWNSNTPSTDSPMPIVAVDWSELFAYASATPPRSEGLQNGLEQEQAELHYAGLSFLLFSLPCKLILLPPYIWEMRNYLLVISQKLKTSMITGDHAKIADNYRDLVRRIRELTKSNKDFKNFLEGNSEKTSQLDSQARELIDSILSESLPSIYYLIQEKTLDFLTNIQQLIYGHGTRRRRIFTLHEIDPSMVGPCEPALENWTYWNRHMERQRQLPSSFPQNRADSIALGYLEILHQHYFWRDQRLLFATRSPAMFRVMGAHPGTFPSSPYRANSNLFSSASSARSWEYFAEIGYYISRQKRGFGFDNVSRRRISAEILMSGLEREKRYGDSPTGVHDDLDVFRLRWEQLRGAFDLEGLGEQSHWKQLRNKDDALLVRLLRSLLSEEQPQKFIDDRSELASRILDKIDDILVRLPATTIGTVLIPTQKSGTSFSRFLPWLTLRFLEPGRLLKESFSADCVEAAGAVISALLRESATVRESDATALLDFASRRSSTNRGRLDENIWFAAFALYCLQRYADSASLFRNWIELREKGAPLSLQLLTRGILSDCYRLREKWRQAFSALDSFSYTVEDSELLRREQLVWLNLRARLVLDWIDVCGEIYDHYPHDSDGNVPDRIFSDLVDRAKSLEAVKEVDADLLAFTFNNLIYGFARCIRDGDEMPAWLKTNRDYILKIVESFEVTLTTTSSPRFLDSVGYFYSKLYRDTKEPAFRQLADDYLSRSFELASNLRQLEVKEAARKHHDLLVSFSENLEV